MLIVRHFKTVAANQIEKREGSTREEHRCSELYQFGPWPVCNADELPAPVGESVILALE
jgi:hypothetical protein